MPFPTITATGQYFEQDGTTPATGQVVFDLSVPLRDPDTDEIVAPVTTKATLDGTGSFSATLATKAVTGAYYNVTELIAGAPRRAYTILVPATGTIDLSDVEAALGVVPSLQVDLDDLSDVNASAPTNLQVLAWDATTSKWIASSATSADLAAHLADTADAHDASAISVVPAGGIASTDVQSALAELDTEKAASSHTHAEGDVTGLTAALAAKADAADLTAHTGDTIDAHDASAISVDPTGLAIVTGTDVQTAIGELDAAVDAGTGGSGGHTIKDAGTPLTQRTGLNFGDGFVVADDAVNDETDVSADIGTGATQVAAGNHNHDAAYEAAGAVAAHTGDTVDAHDASAISFTPAGTVAATDVQAAIEEVAAEAAGGGGVAATLFDANTILKADADDTPTALPVPASTVVGRKASGGIVAATMAELRAMIASGTADATTFLRGDGTWDTPVTDKSGLLRLVAVKKPSDGITAAVGSAGYASFSPAWTQAITLSESSDVIIDVCVVYHMIEDTLGGDFGVFRDGTLIWNGGFDYNGGGSRPDQAQFRAIDLARPAGTYTYEIKAGHFNVGTTKIYSTTSATPSLTGTTNKGVSCMTISVQSPPLS